MQEKNYQVTHKTQDELSGLAKLSDFWSWHKDNKHTLYQNTTLERQLTVFHSFNSHYFKQPLARRSNLALGTTKQRWCLDSNTQSNIGNCLFVYTETNNFVLTQISQYSPQGMNLTVLNHPISFPLAPPTNCKADSIPIFFSSKLHSEIKNKICMLTL